MARIQPDETGRYHAHYTLTETARLVRLALRAKFPDSVFSVTSHPYSRRDRSVGTITVRWQGMVGAPTTRAVQRIMGRYEGVNINPLTSEKIARVVLLDGYLSHFGAEFIFTERAKTARAAAAPSVATSFR
jgi:hypothetical protein